MPMPLDQWRKEVSMQLNLISSAASMILRHCEQLPVRPGFETYAEADMLLAEDALREAIVRVQFARAYYAALPVDGP